MKVLCAGMTTLDLVAAINEQAETDSETRALWSAAIVGGPIGRGAITAARLGANTELVSMIGQGPFAELLRQTLKPEPMTQSFITDKDAVTSQHSLVTLCGAHRTIVWTPQPRGTKEYIDYAISKITADTILLTDCSDAPAHAAIAAAARMRGAKVIVDTGSFKEQADDVLAASDYIIAPEKHLTARFPGLAIHDTLHEMMRRFSPQAVAVTQGARGGAWIARDLTVQRYDAVPVNAIDTCGAGDVFHGAFAFALASGRPIPDAITLAAWAAAQKCTAFGNKGIQVPSS
jgi:sugar/nucleoside kinase (ribokinase family)